MYRQYYDIPRDLFVRKSDAMMRLAVYNSEAIQRADNLRRNGLNPQLIFFGKNLEEHEITKCVEIMQGDKLKAENKVSHFQILRDINHALVTDNP